MQCTGPSTAGFAARFRPVIAVVTRRDASIGAPVLGRKPNSHQTTNRKAN